MDSSKASKAAKKQAKDSLKTLKAEIEEKKPGKKVGESVAGILVATDQTDWQRIRYYNGNMKKTIIDKFQRYQDKKPLFTLQVEGSRKTYGPPYDAALGKHWHTLLSRNLEGKGTKEKKDDELANSLFKTLEQQFGITLLDCDFPLYGFVYNKQETAPKVYLWQDAEADAVGWYYDKNEKRFKYVIVDWKVVDLLSFWTNANTYGMYLHQCLVYARLLQLHLNLNYLPPILFVPISNNNGRDVQPGLFCDYPDECKSAINDDCWSTTLPKPPQRIKGQWPLNARGLKDGPVNQEMLLTDFFVKDAKVKDLLGAFGWNSIEVYDCTGDISVNSKSHSPLSPSPIQDMKKPSDATAKDLKTSSTK